MSEFHYCRTIGVDGGVDAVNGPAIGIDLESILEDGLPPFKAALEIIAALCEILDIADQDGEVHGDLAPDWIFLDDTGAVSIEGFGVKRDETMAPEGRPRGTATDLYGLGYVAYRLFSVEDLDEVDLDDPDAHDDDVIDSIVTINFDGLPEEIIGDIQWFIAKLMSFDREDRPPALEAWRSFIAFADMVDGMPLDEWGSVAVEGGGDRRDAEEATRPPEPPPQAEVEENLGGPVMSAGPLSRGGLSFGGGGAKPGQATAFWSKEQMKAALETEDEEEEYRPQAAAATSFWSKADMEAMARGDGEAPRPKRGGGQAQNRATMMVARSDMDRAETEKKRQQRAAPKPPPPSPATPPTPPPPAARQAPPPSAPAAPPPVIQQTSAPPPAAPPPVIQGPQTQQPAWDEDEDSGGGSMKWIIIGVVVVLLLVCGGIAIVGGGAGVFFGMSGSGGTYDVDVETPDQPGDPGARGTKDTAPEEVPVEDPDEPSARPEPEPRTTTRSGSSSSSGSSSGSSTRSGTTSSSTRPSSGTSGTSTSTTSSGGSMTRPSSGTSSGSSVRPSSVRPSSTPTPPAGPVKGTVKTTQRGQLRCSDGQQVDVDGSLTLEFEPHAVPVTCMVIIDGKMGAVQFERTQAFTCQVGGDEVSCR